MSASSIAFEFAKRLVHRLSYPQRVSNRHMRGPICEPLENRMLLSAVTVTGAMDVVDGDTSSIAALIASPGSDSVISLREAIQAANATAGADVIDLDQLLSGLTLEIANDLIVTESLTINGLGQDQLTLSADGIHAFFNVDMTNDVDGTFTLTDVTIQGNADYFVYANPSNVTLENLTYQGDVENVGDVVIYGDLTTSGDLILSGDITIHGDVIIVGDLTINANQILISGDVIGVDSLFALTINVHQLEINGVVDGLTALTVDVTENEVVISGNITIDESGFDITLGGSGIGSISSGITLGGGSTIDWQTFDIDLTVTNNPPSVLSQMLNLLNDANPAETEETFTYGGVVYVMTQEGITIGGGELFESLEVDISELALSYYQGEIQVAVGQILIGQSEFELGGSGDFVLINPDFMGILEDGFQIALGENFTPDAAPSLVKTDNQTAIAIDVLSNDFDGDQDLLVLASADAVSEQGVALSLNSDGTIAYDPTTAFADLLVGQTVRDHFWYEVSDPYGQTDRSLVFVDVKILADAATLEALAVNNSQGPILTDSQDPVLAHNQVTVINHSSLIALVNASLTPMQSMPTSLLSSLLNLDADEPNALELMLVAEA